MSTPLVLIADDEMLQRIPMSETLRQAGFEVVEAEDGLQALELFQKRRPQVVLLDVMMPRLDGFQVCEALRRFPEGEHLPVLMATGLDDVASINRAYEAGATDFITKPINWPLLGHRVRYLLRASQTAQALARKEKELVATRLEIIRRLGRAAEFRDNETGRHVIRVSKYAALVGQELGLGTEECDLLLATVPMHDIGKIGIPDQILLKPERLTAEEFEAMKLHTVIGAKLLEEEEDGELLAIAQVIALTHHERWDGNGYPRGLKGNEIPLFGRICTVVDVFDALTSERPYKHAWGVEEALNEIRRCAGRQFDPQLVAIFETVFQEVLRIKRDWADPEITPEPSPPGDSPS